MNRPLFVRLLLISASALLLAGCLGPPRSVFQPDGVTITRDVAIGQRDGRDLHLDIYRADHRTETQPIALWIHGGGWYAGSRYPNPLARMALRGYTVIAIEYRFTKEAPWPAQLQDVHFALDWIADHADQWQIDPQRIVAWGASAGGHMALHLAQGPEPRVQAVVAWFPPSDLIRLMDESSDWRMRFALHRLLQGDPRDNPEARSRAAALSIDPAAIAAPIMLIHGDQDRFIPVTHSQQLAAAVRAYGSAARLVIMPGVGHGNRAMANAAARQRAHAFQDPLLQPQIPADAPQ